MTLKRALVFCTAGSVAGLLLMDLVMVVEFSFANLPAVTYLELIGSVFGGGVVAGIVAHFVLGAVMGIALGIAVVKVDILSITTMGKGVLLGVAAGAITIPFGCVPFALLIGQPVFQVLSFSTVPHLVWGLVLGLAAGIGLKPAPTAGEQ
jgi:hypothetical protein